MDDNIIAQTETTAGRISLTSLAGSQSQSRYICHLLEFDDAKILLDCGVSDMREEFPGDFDDDQEEESIQYLEKLKELAPQLTLVLLSSPTIGTLGLLPYLVSKCRLACPVYATFQCRTLGQLTLEEWVESRSQEEQHDVSKLRLSAEDDTKSSASTSTFDPKLLERADEVAWRVTKEEIQLSFSRITPVVYSQIIRLSGRSNSPFSLLAHPSGTTLGGTLWSLRSATTDSLLYAPVFNHVKERTLDPASFLIKSKADSTRMEVNDAMKRAGILIIGSESSKVTATKAKERDRNLLDVINATLDNSGSILMPTDTAGRFLEILVLLEQHWSFSMLSNKYPLCLLAKNGEDILGTIRRLAESLGGQLGADEAERERVLRFRNVRIFTSIEALLSRYPAKEPKLVVCSPSSLSYGSARQALAATFAPTPNNLILLTSPGPAGSLTHHLFKLWNDRQSTNPSTRYGSGKVGQIIDFDRPNAGGAITDSAPTVRIKIRKKVVLQGEELIKYLEDEKAAKEKEQKAKAMADRNRRMMEADNEDDSSDSSDDSSDDEGMDGVPGRRKNRDMVGMEGEGMGDPANQGMGAEPGSGPTGRGMGGGPGRRGPRAGVEPGAISAGAWDEFFDDVKSSTTVGGFDIYVRRSKHQHNANGDPSTDIAGDASSHQLNQTRYRMFPFYERRRKVDGYGEYIDIEGWKTRGKAPEEVEAALNALDDVLGKRKREEEEQKEQEPPHKFVVGDLNLQIRCKILVVDMEGKADGRALRSILPLIEPKKLVLINGDTESTQDLASALQSVSLAGKDIFSPTVGETVKIADVTKSFSVRLDDSLMSALALRKIDEYEVVPVKGTIGQSDESTIPVLVPNATISMAADSEVQSDADAEMTNGDSDALPKLNAPHFIGDIKLALLKSNLSAQNVPVTFYKGSLICGPVRVQPSVPAGPKSKDTRSAKLAKLSATAARASPTPEVEDEYLDTSGGKVILRKEGGQIVLEGAPGDTFYAVRAAVYDLHAVAS